MAEKSSIFDMIGPVMIGPSSSHTAGVVPISYRDPSMERFLRWQQVIPCMATLHTPENIACEAGSCLVSPVFHRSRVLLSHRALSP